MLSANKNIHLYFTTNETNYANELDRMYIMNILCNVHNESVPPMNVQAF
ncbi:hypothetical protein HMPREF9148_01249 [Prevotella sp. F0091]|nr:hypothetical protein HMPREF9148_01249 [Prevotella sp. F0091]